MSLDVSKQAPPIKPSIPKVKAGEKPTFLDLSPGEVARQLTLIDFKKYQQIPLHEFHNQAWNSKNAEEKAPHILAKINYFNQVKGNQQLTNEVS